MTEQPRLTVAETRAEILRRLARRPMGRHRLRKHLRTDGDTFRAALDRALAQGEILIRVSDRGGAFYILAPRDIENGDGHISGIHHSDCCKRA